MIHETPSSHVPIEPFNPDPIPGETRFTISGPTPHEYVSRPQVGPITVFDISSDKKADYVSPQPGHHYQANIHGRSIHPIEIRATDGETFVTIVTDEKEEFTVPLNGDLNKTPVRSIASKVDTGDRIDTTLLFFDPTSSR